MDVASMCPLRVAAVVWQPRPGAFALTVACKATYRLEPVSSPLAGEQDEVHEADQHWDDDDTRSVSAACDLAPFKRRADVMLVGSAFAPGGAPVRSLVARLQIGEVDKAIEVWSDRSFTPDGRLLEGARFVKMPLRWERAAGGPNSANPVGMRFDAPPSVDGRVAVPNLQPPWKAVARPGDTFEPIGFGPVAPSWPGRAWLLHHHAPGWSHLRWFDRPLPHDVDPRYFNAAPPDQQTDPLPADARILLENLHPAHPRLVTNLVPVRPRAMIERPGRAPEPLELTCDTLCIDTDRGLCTLTFRGRVPLAHPGEAGRVTVHLEGSEPVERGAPRPSTRAAAPSAPPEAARLSQPMLAPLPPPLPPPRAPRQRSATLDGVQAAQAAALKASALPFLPAKLGADQSAARVQAFSGLGAAPLGASPPAVEAPPDSYPPPPPPPTPPPPMPGSPRRRSATLDGVEVPSTSAMAGSALPFAPPRPSADEGAARIQPFTGLPFRKTEKAEARLFDGGDRAGVFSGVARKAPPLPSRPSAPEETTGTIDIAALRGERTALPFAPGPATRPPSAPPAPLPLPSLGTIPPPPLAAAADVAPAFWRRITASQVDEAELLEAEADDGDEDAPEADTIRPPALPLDGATPFPAPPPLAFLAPPLPRFAELPPSTIEPVATAAPAPAPAPEEEVEPLPVDVYAIVKIAFWSEGEGSRAAIEETVRDLGLDEDAFRAGEERLLEALAAEAREGHATLARELRAAMKRALRAAAERAAEAAAAPDGTGDPGAHQV